MVAGGKKFRHDWSRGRVAIRLPKEAAMSKQHCQLDVADSFIRITDLTTTNGTLVNGVRNHQGLIVK